MFAAQVGQINPLDVVLVGQNTRNVTAVALKKQSDLIEFVFSPSARKIPPTLYGKERIPQRDARRCLVGAQHHFVLRN